MIKSLHERYRAATELHRHWRTVWEDCYDFAIPNRAGFLTHTPGDERMDRVFDETAIISTAEFASRMQLGLTPPFMHWLDFVPGAMVPPDQRESLSKQLAGVKDVVFEAINESNFITQMYEAYLDLAVGTTVLLCEERDGRIHFSTLAQNATYLERGPFDTIGGIFRHRIEKYRDIETVWPDGTISKDLREKIEKQPNKDCKIVEANVRDYSNKATESWKHYVCIDEDMNKDDSVPLFEYEFTGPGAFPLIPARWSKAAGEVYGRGPLINALPAIRTANTVIELTLDNAEMAITGMYQAADDGVLNPDTVQIVAGSIIPIAQNSRGLQPLGAAGDFNVANLILEEQRANIKRALYDEMLGPVDKTPMSATEVVQRVSELQRRIGSPIGRLTYELLVPVIRRVAYILTENGTIRNMPLIDGRQVQAKPISPLARQQQNEEVENIAQYAMLIGQIFGPQMVNLMLDGEVASETLAKLRSVPPDIIRSRTDRKQLTDAIRQMAQEQNASPSKMMGRGPDQSARM